MKSGWIVRTDIDAERAFVAYGRSHRFPLGDGVEAISLREMTALLRDR
ncbi:MAG: hypothetical protein OXE58_06685 [Acidobacteria bacterium]|nr:hypothetical protein [Acidobacteriota bacterium]